MMMMMNPNRQKSIKRRQRNDTTTTNNNNNKVVIFLTTSLLLILSRLQNQQQQGGVFFVDGTWVDPDTKEEFRTTEALTKDDDREYELVFSDEFETNGRTFHDGQDPRWTAIHKNDYTNEALHLYYEENAYTNNGVLNITSELKDNKYLAFHEDTKTFFVDTKHVQSGMLQGWNKFCLTGGIVEISAQLPGDSSVGGLWPALWLLGNLARATYIGSSNFIWPYSYNQCDRNNQASQELDACSSALHYGMEPKRGRGSPEIDILEAMGGGKGALPSTHIEHPYFSASLQVAPGLSKGRPTPGKMPKEGRWYENLEYGNRSLIDPNPFFYGVKLWHETKARTYQSDAISANRQLNSSFFEKQHIYRIEWEPPLDDGTDGYIRWYVDGEFLYGIKSASLHDLTKTEIPSEPMYIILNTAIASSWGFPPCPKGCDCDCFDCNNEDCTCGLPEGYCDNFPAGFEIEYVRAYQAVNDTRHLLGCSTDKRPTEKFIEGHKKRYTAMGGKRPLEPQQRGGKRCNLDSECNGDRNGGQCVSGRCDCFEEFTGPNCLAHNAFYDRIDRTPPPPFPIQFDLFPKGLLLMFFFLGLSFVIMLTVIVWRKRREEKLYQQQQQQPHQLPAEHAHQQQMIGTSYQNPNIHPDFLTPATYPSMPDHFNQNKGNTYLMVDPQLIDQ